jgi:hypothetical protein
LYFDKLDVFSLLAPETIPAVTVDFNPHHSAITTQTGAASNRAASIIFAGDDPALVPTQTFRIFLQENP